MAIKFSYHVSAQRRERRQAIEHTKRGGGVWAGLAGGVLALGVLAVVAVVVLPLMLALAACAVVGLTAVGVLRALGGGTRPRVSEVPEPGPSRFTASDDNVVDAEFRVLDDHGRLPDGADGGAGRQGRP